ncbi:MAG TPA: VRR-NUC domain-containing protein [Acidimicrobiales bacterium]|nr:VRR-NUC domain-containing protein [Acidimicrobiales bacterium]
MTWPPGDPARVGMAEARRSLNMATSERDFQGYVTDLADVGRWLWFHDHDARRNRAGLPDIIAVRAPRLVFLELKSMKGALRPAQEEWLDQLGTCTSVEAHVLHPDEADRALEVLR